MIENIITELEDVDAHVAGGLERLADASTRGRQLAEIYRAYRTAKGDRVSSAEIYDVAAAAVIADQAPNTTAILFAPERLSLPSGGWWSHWLSGPDCGVSCRAQARLTRMPLARNSSGG